MLTAAEAKSLGGITRQIRGLLQGIDQLPEAFEQVEGLEVSLATAKKEKQIVESDTAALKTTFAKLDGDYQRLQTQYASLDEEYRDKRQQLEDSLVGLRADLAAGQLLRQETEDQLAALKAKFA